MDNRILMAGAAVLVIGAGAFAAGHYLNQPASPPATSQEPEMTGAPADSTQPPQDQEAASQPAAETVPALAPSAPPPAVAPKPTTRPADYADDEDAYGPPPPPPPPPPREFRDRPNPFAVHFNTFPMRHSGQGTLASPLTWTAQTALGNGREADLKISILVPEPAANDKGAFWRKWGGRNQNDLMPDVTHGTPVVVAGSAAVVVAVDPQILDLNAPASLVLNGRDGQRIYRSREVAPARGSAWNSDGARWVFVPDADFYRRLRGGDDIAISVRNRIDGHAITIPFDTRDFAPTARQFERSLSRRINDVAASWNRVRPGAPPPSGHDHDHGPGWNNNPPNRGSQPPNGPSRGDDMKNAALVAKYRAPKDSCGTQPPYPAKKPADYAKMSSQELAKAKKPFNTEKKWMACETKWLKTYGTSVTALGKKVADKGQDPTTALKAVRGGDAVVAAYDKAQAEFNATSTVWLGHVKAYTRATGAVKTTPQPNPPADNPPPAKPDKHGKPGKNSGKPVRDHGQRPNP